MNDLEKEFKAKGGEVADWWLNKSPQELKELIGAEIDKITSLAEAQAFLKQLAKWYGDPIWFYVQIQIKGK